MTTIPEERWQELEHAAPAHGLISLRATAESSRDVFIGYSRGSGRRMFWLEVEPADIPDDYELPKLKVIHAEVAPTDAGRTKILVELLETPLVDVFRALVNDLLAAIASSPDDADAVDALARRLGRWANLLSPGRLAGLTLVERRGLYGELHIMRELLEIAGNKLDVLNGWTGPQRANQDYQFALGAIEVKTTSAKQPQKVVVANERELDDVGVQTLLLAHVSLDERKGGKGETLPEAVAKVRAWLESEPQATSKFNDLLLQVGYIDEHAALYAEPHYALREDNFFLVKPGFPRLTESDLPDGVGNVTYSIELAALKAFVVKANDALSKIGF